ALCAALAAAFATSLAPAQDPASGIARLKEVKGNVLLSRESGLAAGAESTRLTEHTRVITTANSEVIVVYDNGCEVRLKENQRFEVETGKPCAALMAQAQSILLEPAGAMTASAAGGAMLFWTALPALGGAAIGLGFLQDSREKTPLSPS
ncbi:MAG: hypothetical protein H7Y14_11145, partial [Burkholderiales bacterium]|nr:hypothetical protein [Burkholderiales bacterium]